MAIEYFGSLTKEENLVTLETDIAPNTLVLENLESFPGYYHAHPDNRQADSFFLVTANAIRLEKVLRYTQLIKKKSGISFEGTPANIHLHNSDLSAIRIRGLEDQRLLNELQCYYRDAGVEFMKKRKVEGEALIHIKKLFRLESVTSSIYRDATEEMFYLRIDRDMTWSHFKSVTKKVKQNVDNPVFDGALAVFYSHQMIDAVRIFAKNLSIEALERIHDRYIELMDKE